jgi:hypothetical protein
VDQTADKLPEGKTMRNGDFEVDVTLEPDLYERLHNESTRLGVPFEWVVASLVADTIETAYPEPALC